MVTKSTGEKPPSLRSARRHLRSRGIHIGLTNSLLADRALARGIEMHPDAHKRLTLRVGDRSFWFNGAKSNLNARLARRCAMHKEVTSRLLRAAGVNTPENAVFGPEEAERAWAWARSILPVVVKPSSGESGRWVHLEISEFEEFRTAFETVGRQTGDVLVEQFVDGEEHRVLMVYGKVAAAARRLPAHVVGDGRQSVRALIAAKNTARVRSGNPTHFELPVDELTRTELAAQGLTLDAVPDDGRFVRIRANSNVHTGGDGVDATDELRPEEVELCERAIRAIPGLRLAGLDMLLPRGGVGEAPYVLEINSSPMISGHHFPWVGQERDVAGMILDALFPRSAQGPTHAR